MKRILIIFIVYFTVLTTGCVTDEERQTDISDINYTQLVDLLNDTVMNPSRLMYTLVEDTIETELWSETFIDTYNIVLIRNYKNFSHNINSNTIEVLDELTNTTTTYMSNVNINSLEEFSELILDSYSDEFTYYSMKDFIPLALELISLPSFSYYLDNTIFDMNQYRLSGVIDKLNISNDLHNILLNISPYYSEVHNNSDLEIVLTFRTDKDNEYFHSAFEFSINEKEITRIF